MIVKKSPINAYLKEILLFLVLLQIFIFFNVWIILDVGILFIPFNNDNSCLYFIVFVKLIAKKYNL